MATKACGNCGRQIGNLEASYLHDGHVVCSECNPKVASTGDRHIASFGPFEVTSLCIRWTGETVAMPNIAAVRTHQVARWRVDQNELLRVFVSCLAIVVGFAAILALFNFALFAFVIGAAIAAGLWYLPRRLPKRPMPPLQFTHAVILTLNSGGERMLIVKDQVTANSLAQAVEQAMKR